MHWVTRVGARLVVGLVALAVPFALLGVALYALTPEQVIWTVVAVFVLIVAYELGALLMEDW